ncbi:hypothetical protein GCM10018793_19890 [Streptomyces sulfonofaciens]|uniref:Secreted protein n=1 Tax=Streptomyces sulfonofaciens TaxID=68272 RepID=A0A919G023_9ACTN|nr:DUF6167 family protein [Streptomyces sulfonofaciens]GHH75707.1 hypothetical protein GCM10018793_19890 [Streptomyces sulfonofaciens]
MFRRTFWFTAGAAAGVWATTKVNRKLRKLTPDSLAAQAAHRALDAGHRLKDFALDVRAGMAQREAELGEALGLPGPDRGSTRVPAAPALPSARRRPALGPAGKAAPAQAAPAQERAPDGGTARPLDHPPHDSSSGYAARTEHTAYSHDRNEDH